MARAKPDSDYKLTRPDGSTVYRKRIWTARDPLTGKRKQVTVEAASLRAFRAAIADAQRSVPLSELTLAAYLVDHWLPHKTASGRCGQNTLNSYALWLRKHVIPHLGSVTLAELAPLPIQAWANKLAASQSPASVQSYVTVLRMALRDAVRWRLITFNPAEGVTVPVKAPRSRQVWSEDELTRFLASTADSPYHALWCVLGRGGLRIGEALALGWADVDQAAGVIHVRRTMTRGASGGAVIGQTTKTRQVRVVALDAETMAALAALPRVALQVFPYGRHVVASALRQACEALGWEPITPHGLRHMHMTHVIRAGIPMPVAMARLGHRSPEMALHYTHPDVSDQSAAVERLYGRAVRRLDVSS